MSVNRANGLDRAISHLRWDERARIAKHIHNCIEAYERFSSVEAYNAIYREAMGEILMVVDIRFNVEHWLEAVLKPEAWEQWWDTEIPALQMTPNRAISFGCQEDLLAYVRTYGDTYFT